MVSEPLESSEGLAMADEGLNEAEAAVLKTSFDQFALGQEEIRKSMNEVKVMLLQLLKAQISTPLWISELSDMADEVRDRMILVKTNSQMYPINDLVIYHLFSEIGTVEDVRYLPTESGFHSRIRFRIKQSSDWAFHYYNGRCLYQGCCKLEIHRAKDILCWNAQRIGHLSKELAKYDDVVKQGVVPTQIDSRADLITSKESSDEFAHQVLKEMSKPIDKNQIVANEPASSVVHQVFEKSPESQEGYKTEPLNEIKEGNVLNNGYLEEGNMLDEMPMMMVSKKIEWSDEFVKEIDGSIQLRSLLAGNFSIDRVMLLTHDLGNALVMTYDGDEFSAYDPGGETMKRKLIPLAVFVDYEHVAIDEETSILFVDYIPYHFHGDSICVYLQLHKMTLILISCGFGISNIGEIMMGNCVGEFVVDPGDKWFVFGDCVTYLSKGSAFDGVYISTLEIFFEFLLLPLEGIVFMREGATISLNSWQTRRVGSGLVVDTIFESPVADTKTSPTLCNVANMVMQYMKMSFILPMRSAKAFSIRVCEAFTFDPGGKRIIVIVGDFFLAWCVIFWADYTTQGFDEQFSFDSRGKLLMLAGMVHKWNVSLT